MRVVLDFLKHGSNGVLVGGVAGLCAWSAAGGPSLQPVWWVALGALLFYASEYTWHRFVFHAPPSSWGWLRRMQHRLHYDHHAEPARLDLLFLPAWFLVPNLAINAGIFALVFGTAAVAPLLVGVMLAILHYEWVHYVAHIPAVPLTAVGRWMKRYHLRHHFISEKLWFGVSNPMFDVVYRTYAEPRDVKKSATVRTLETKR